MAQSYLPYPEYDGTGHEIIEALPEGWAIKKVRYLILDGQDGIKIGPFGSALKLGDMVSAGVRVYGQENVIKNNFLLGERKISEDKFKIMRVYETRADDLLITMMGTSGKCQIVPQDAERGIIDSHLLRLRVERRSILPKFFQILLGECMEVKAQIELSGKGSIMHGLNSSIVKSLLLPLPDIPTQETILLFLDHETAQIDALIAKQQRLIELLEEKRQAVISHAVTKGLNPDAPLRPSGIDWLGDVPEHWEVKPLKFLCEDGDGIQMGPFGGMLTDLKSIDTGYKLFGQENTIKADFYIGERFLSKQQYRDLARYRLEPGNLVLTRKGSIGNCQIVPVAASAGIADSDTIRVKTKPTVAFPAFVRLCLSEAKYVSVQLEMNKRGAILSGLNTAVIANLRIVLPGTEEQEAILHLVDGQKRSFATALASIESAITLLKERRTALISAAVTGKIDVSDWQSSKSISDRTTEATEGATI